MIRAFLTFGYTGFLKPAPGTWGSLAALVVAYLLYQIGGPWLVTVAAALFTVLGLRAVDVATREEYDKDPSHIVIDEVVGQWIALLPVLFGAWNNDVAVLRLWPGWVGAFVLFRLFDILKPGPVGWADRKKGAVGVMLDDVFAGLLAAVGVGLLAALFHLVLMR